MFSKNDQTFDMADLPIIDISKKPVAIDISFLAHENHTNAFIDIFEKMIIDNWKIFKNYDVVEIEGKKPLGDLATSLNNKGGVQKLKAHARELARELYFTYNDEVLFVFYGSERKKELLIAFDNPYFAFTEEI